MHVIYFLSCRHDVDAWMKDPLYLQALYSSCSFCPRWETSEKQTGLASRFCLLALSWPISLKKSQGAPATSRGPRSPLCADRCQWLWPPGCHCLTGEERLCRGCGLRRPGTSHGPTITEQILHTFDTLSWQASFGKTTSSMMVAFIFGQTYLGLYTAGLHLSVHLVCKLTAFLRKTMAMILTACRPQRSLCWWQSPAWSASRTRAKVKYTLCTESLQQRYVPCIMFQARARVRTSETISAPPRWLPLSHCV